MSLNTYDKNSKRVIPIAGNEYVEIDSALSTTSEHPLQNKVITTELNKKANSTEVDSQIQTLTNNVQTLTNQVGSNTSNISANATAIAKCETLVVSVPSFSALPQTITNADIEDDMVVVNSVLSNPSAQTGDWTVTTSSGSLTISGSIGGTTTATLYLMKSR